MLRRDLLEGYIFSHFVCCLWLLPYRVALSLFYILLLEFWFSWFIMVYFPHYLLILQKKFGCLFLHYIHIIIVPAHTLCWSQNLLRLFFTEVCLLIYLSISHEYSRTLICLLSHHRQTWLSLSSFFFSCLFSLSSQHALVFVYIYIYLYLFILRLCGILSFLGFYILFCCSLICLLPVCVSVIISLGFLKPTKHREKILFVRSNNYNIR